MILIQNSYFNHHLVKLFIFLHFKFIINAKIIIKIHFTINTFSYNFYAFFLNDNTSSFKLNSFYIFLYNLFYLENYFSIFY